MGTIITILAYVLFLYGVCRLSMVDEDLDETPPLPRIPETLWAVRCDCGWLGATDDVGEEGWCPACRMLPVMGPGEGK